MNSFRDKILTFMRGRYGTDALTGFLLALYFIAGIVKIFFRFRVAYIFISVIMALLLVLIFYRVLSRNIEKRTRENDLFLKYFDIAKPHLILLKDRIRDIRTKRYRRCPCCKHVLRLPYKRGRHSVRCPHCSKSFNVRIL